MEQPPIPAKLTALLGFNAGYVDTAGFLALNGLFAAHVTGNFVTLGASFAHGTAGALTKLSALPVFCLVVLLSRLVSVHLHARGQPVVSWLLLVKAVALLGAAVVMLVKGPFPDSDTWPAFTAGMLLVGAMAIQNGVQRMYMASAPPSTLMTGTTTQVMIDLADMFRGVTGEERDAALGRLRKMIRALLAFAIGCALAALAYIVAGMWCFALPPVVAAWTLVISRTME